MAKKRKAKFRVGQVVYCDSCEKYQRLLATRWDKEGFWYYALDENDKESWRKGELGHLDSDLRPLTPREIGPRRKR